LVATLIYAEVLQRMGFSFSNINSQGYSLKITALFLLLACLGIIGDLFESWMKRTAGVKDSGNILPGHGGVLDRIDALTSTLPIAALALGLMGKLL
jgi:phosphatidate cytidylyltransferase